jgi:outer membrane protein assembly factor BamB
MNFKKIGLWFTFLFFFAGCVFGQEQMKKEANWPSFRGNHAAGSIDGQNLPDTWNGESGQNIRWKTRIPGLAHSSPIIWGDKLFVTTAISSLKDVSYRHGLYGDGDASEDRSVHDWCIYCLDKKNGEFIWHRTAVTGAPIDKRHIKSTYANSTPATDGRYIAALFGSQGLYLYDMGGNLVWKKDLGRMDVGAYDLPEYEWGPASSPIIHKGKVIVQVDTQKESFIIACDVQSGKVLWKTMRDELPSWGTPTVVESSKAAELVTNSSNYIYGYNPDNGEELWRLGGSSKITAPTPVFEKDLIVVCSGRNPEAPIFAIRTGARGDITLNEKQTSNASVVWSKIRRGSYMPTPLIYRGYVYILQNQGRLDCYDLITGEEMYRERIIHSGGGFSASPVASDGNIYLPGEDGEIFFVKAGPEFKLVATNKMGELLMATPAISDGVLYVRAEHHLFAVGNMKD